MSKNKRRLPPTPAKRSGIALIDGKSWDIVSGRGYTRLADCPEIQTGILRIADLISVMTIHLMANTKDGDKRIKNELSHKVDISPCRYITRRQWMVKTVKDILYDGNSIALPHYGDGGRLEDIQPLPRSKCTIYDEEYGYTVAYNAARFEPDEILHFSHNPDDDYPWHGRGYSVSLKKVADSLGVTRAAAQALMKSPKPSIIVKVDGLTEEFASPTGRKQLREQYLDVSEDGEPWFIPAEAFDVNQVAPLNLNDLAVIDSETLDKRTAASILGVPPFVLGAGDFDAEEYNNFVRSVVLPIARGIEQELTRKLLYSPEWYFRFNPRSLYAYSITELAEVNCNMVDRAIIDRNEARDALGYTPREGLSELAILENYIPYSKIGDQKKLEANKKKDGKNSADQKGDES